jgi:hypothetical protein
MIAVVPPPHHDDRCGSDDDGRRDPKADVDIDAGVGRLRLCKQCESQEGDHTPQAYDRCKTFHDHILAVEHQLCSITCRVIGSMLPHICRLVVHSAWHTREERSQSKWRNADNATCFYLYSTLRMSYDTRLGAREVTKTESMAPGSTPIKRAPCHSDKPRAGRNATGIPETGEAALRKHPVPGTIRGTFDGARVAAKHASSGEPHAGIP